jgi:hypothetical protein
MDWFSRRKDEARLAKDAANLDAEIEGFLEAVANPRWPTPTNDVEALAVGLTLVTMCGRFNHSKMKKLAADSQGMVDELMADMPDIDIASARALADQRSAEWIEETKHIKEPKE